MPEAAAVLPQEDQVRRLRPDRLPQRLHRRGRRGEIKEKREKRVAIFICDVVVCCVILSEEERCSVAVVVLCAEVRMRFFARVFFPELNMERSTESTSIRAMTRFYFVVRTRERTPRHTHTACPAHLFLVSCFCFLYPGVHVGSK